MKQRHKDKFTDEELLEQYNLNPVLSQLSRYFDVPDVTIWRRCKKLGLSFKIGGKRTKYELIDILEGKYPSYPTLKLKNRIIKEKLKVYECEECGITEWNKKPIILHLDHIDGDNHNHKFSNLRLLCPNCHSQTDTWCGKNK
jgi:5-methylcytosine-specific restriction endonuclease McrA